MFSTSVTILLSKLIFQATYVFGLDHTTLVIMDFIPHSIFSIYDTIQIQFYIIFYTDFLFLSRVKFAHCVFHTFKENCLKSLCAVHKNSSLSSQGGCYLHLNHVTGVEMERKSEEKNRKWKYHLHHESIL
jgi:hypothetical protein